MDKVKAFFKKSIALVLFFGGTYLLWWNEGFSANIAGAIGEARPITVKLLDVSKIDPSFNEKMVHAIGLADTEEIITDPVIGAQVSAISLHRKVQYYQITESKHTSRRTVGNTTEEVTTYTYDEKWADRPINSSYFYYKEYDKNAILMEIPDETFYALDVTFGAYRLSPSIIESISGLDSIDISIETDIITKLEAQITPPSILSAGGSYVHVRGNVVQFGRSPHSPEIGDIRVTYTAVKPSNISVLAQISGDTFRPFKTSNEGAFSIVHMGIAEMDEMYGDLESKNTANMWIRRVMGVLFICFGLKMATKLRAKVAFPAGIVWSAMVIAAALV